MAVPKVGSSVYLNNVIGTVEEIDPPNKAVVTFNYKGAKERALLLSNKLLIDGKSIPEWHRLYEVVHQGSLIKFTCHTFNDTGDNRCKWFISNAWRQHTFDLGSPLGTPIVTLKFGLYNVSGFVTEVDARRCIVSYTNLDDKDENVLVLASKVYIKGRRTKQSLHSVLHVDDVVTFDATPCDPEENSNGCKWFATHLWVGRRPPVDYDNAVNIPHQLDSKNLLGYIKQVALNPKSTFMCGSGYIVSLLNEEYGLALIALRHNHWQSLLFHRSVCFLFGLSLSTYDLKKVFKEGDIIRFIAVTAPDNKLLTQWLATQVSVYVGSALSELPPLRD